MRKIIQISCVNKDEHLNRIYALCDDGSIWAKDDGIAEHHWYRVNTDEVTRDTNEISSGNSSTTTQPSENIPLEDAEHTLQES